MVRHPGSDKRLVGGAPHCVPNQQFRYIIPPLGERAQDGLGLGAIDSMFYPLVSPGFIPVPVRQERLGQAHAGVEVAVAVLTCQFPGTALGGADLAAAAYRYAYAPLALLSLEEAIGESAMKRTLEILVTDPPDMRYGADFDHLIGAGK